MACAWTLFTLPPISSPIRALRIPSDSTQSKLRILAPLLVWPPPTRQLTRLPLARGVDPAERAERFAVVDDVQDRGGGDLQVEVPFRRLVVGGPDGAGPEPGPRAVGRRVVPGRSHDGDVGMPCLQLLRLAQQR